MEHSSKICRSERSTPLLKRIKWTNLPKAENVAKGGNGEEGERNVETDMEVKPDMEVYKDKMDLENLLLIKG